MCNQWDRSVVFIVIVAIFIAAWFLFACAWSLLGILKNIDRLDLEARFFFSNHRR